MEDVFVGYLRDCGKIGGIVMFFLAELYKMIMVSAMNDITGKKFSLQDWVTRRAANQVGGMASRVSVAESVQPVAIKRAVNGDDDALASLDSADQEQDDRDVIMSHMTGHVDMSRENQEQSEDKMAIEAFKAESKAAIPEGSPSVSSAGGGAVQQLQIVRLLSDLGERLRQSEKEREVLWKELESCRKLISDLDGKNSKSELSYKSLKEKVSEKEQFITDLLEKQNALEDLVKAQGVTFETAKTEQTDLKGKLEEKLSNIETAAGSAIVRIEDALVENSKLAKRVEQLSQDKVRLSRKLEAMEEALTQTQDTLKAKALVLLTDQALATRTNLPQTPAWTGDDTLRVSARAQSVEQGSREPARNMAQDTGPLADIAASIKKQQQASDISNKAFVVALVVLVIASGVLISQINYKSLPMFSGSASPENAVVDQASIAKEPDQQQLMADIAKLASQIEPAAEDAQDVAQSGALHLSTDEILEPTEFDKAIDAEDRALEKFNAEAPAGEVSSRIKPDASLLKSVKAIEAKAFDGDAMAQHDLAAIYTAGHSGVKVNYDRAAKWFFEAAHQNISNAQYNLGVLTQQGLGVKQDIGQAIDLYRVAAANGHSEAEYNLAIAYIEGVGTEYNPQIAAAYFQKAAAGGIVEGAYNLGLLHENGLLGESQPDEAVFWYSLAANKGNEQAQAALKALKTQLSMSDEDAARIVDRIAQTKPGFADQNGHASMPEAGNNIMKAAQNQVETPAVTGSIKSPASSSVESGVVTQIQEQLRQTGYYDGSLDGKLSGNLTSAIKDYQRAQGLKQDGLANENLLVRLLSDQLPASGE